jgi:hypothetical protein
MNGWINRDINRQMIYIFIKVIHAHDLEANAKAYDEK